MPALLDVLQIHPDDNVCVAVRPLKAGTMVTCGEVRFELSRDVRLGGKLALRALHRGERVLKYGEPIGSVSEDVPLGGHVHTHNLQSDYLKTYARGEWLADARPDA